MEISEAEQKIVISTLREIGQAPKGSQFKILGIVMQIMTDVDDPKLAQVRKNCGIFEWNEAGK